MKKHYPPNLLDKIIIYLLTNFKSLLLMLVLAGLPSVVNAQQVYTILEGEQVIDIQGVTPFSTNDRNQRSQYLYTSDLLQNVNAPIGFITAVAVKIVQVAYPIGLQPENLQIKMGLTSAVVLPPTLVPNLSVYYSSATENITGPGWYTITLDTPMAWDGYSNVIIEFCRTNTNVGTNFRVETYLGLINEYRTSALASSAVNGNGCVLTGTTTITLPNRRLIPAMQLTMANPCQTNPSPGTIVVNTATNYCSAPFTLSVVDDTVASGLSYQWQSSFHDDTNFIDIIGATSQTLTTTQDFATYYRRGTMCDELGVMFYPPALLVDGPDCLCNPTVTTVDATGITNVSFNTINQSSTTSNSYTDFTNIQTDANLVASIPLSARVNVINGSVYTKAWIDWNQDGMFAADESYDLGMANVGVDISSGIIANVVVPSNALLGLTTMRVRASGVDNMALLDPCSNLVNGESEDYTINVMPELGIPNIDFVSNTIIAFAAKNLVNIRSQSEEIAMVKIYDLSGRLLYFENGGGTRELSIMLQSSSSQILIVEIATISGQKVTKKVKIY